MTQTGHYRECLLKITYDDAPYASVVVPLGDFFGLGHGMVNSFQVGAVQRLHQFPLPVRQTLRPQLLRTHAVCQKRQGGAGQRER